MIQPITNPHYVIVTGAMGAGKSTLLNQLEALGYMTIDEPAREIIAQQRAIEGEGIYDRDPKLFYQLMLSRSLFQYQQYQGSEKTIIWDRGIADNIAYAKLFDLDATAAEKAAQLYRYHTTVFFLPAWQDIYVNDEERKMSFEDAKAFADSIKNIYTKLGYKLLEVPFGTPQERVNFVQQNIRVNPL